jgi:hypothetical protein
VCVHVECVDRKVVSGQIERFENLVQSKISAVPVNDLILSFFSSAHVCKGLSLGKLNRANIRTALHFGLDESQQMLLIHASRMMNVRVDLSDVVKIPAKSDLRRSRQQSKGANTEPVWYALASIVNS